MRDVMCSGYVAGGNTRFFGQPNNAASGFSFNKAAQDIDVTDALDNRLSFNDQAEGEYDSMLAFACGYGDGAKRDQVISITDRLLPWEVTGGENEGKKYFPGASDNYNLYRKAWKLNTVHFGEDVRAAQNMEFISQGKFPSSHPPEFHHHTHIHTTSHPTLAGSMNNALCFLGPHRKYNPFSKQYHELVPGQGHFGPDAIPGVSCHHFTTFTTHTTPHRSCRLTYLARARCNRMHVGVEARPSPSRRLATPWCHLRSRRTHRCSCPRNEP